MLDARERVLVEFAPYDVVLSDMAPNTSGFQNPRSGSELRIVHARAPGRGHALAKPGSHFVAKIFMSADFQAARRMTGERYERCQVIRPEGTRQQSSEVFIVGLGLANRRCCRDA